MLNALTKQVQKSQVKMIPMSVISEVLISGISEISKNLDQLSLWQVNSLFVELSEPTFHTKKCIKFERKTEGWAWALWESMNGSSNETKDMK